MRARRIGVLVISLVAFATTMTEAGSAWQTMGGSLNVPRAGLTGAAVGGMLYAIGGESSGTHSATLEKYDPATDRWTIVSPMPTARHSISCAVVGNYIYAIGGHVWNSRSEVERYDTAADSWESMAPLGTARSGPGVCAYQGKIYVFGGNSYGSYQTSIEVYDPSANTWTTIGDMPSAGEPWRAAVIGAKAYLFGPNSALWGYDFAAGTWETSLPSLNTVRGFPELVVVGGRLWAIGGGTPSGASAATESWAPGEGSWRIEPSLSTARAQLASGLLGDQVYVFGGYSGTSYFGSTESLSLCVQPVQKPFTFVAGTPAKSSEVNANFDVLYQAVNDMACEVQRLKTEVQALKQAK